MGLTFDSSLGLQRRFELRLIRVRELLISYLPIDHDLLNLGRAFFQRYLRGWLGWRHRLRRVKALQLRLGWFGQARCGWLRNHLLGIWRGVRHLGHVLLGGLRLLCRDDHSLVLDLLGCAGVSE